MFYYLNLLRSTSSTRHLCKNIRSFSFIHQNSVNVISKRNGNFNFFSKRLKSNNSPTNKAGQEVKAQTVKLKVSDLRRLLSLAKQEKWKITGGMKSKTAKFHFVTSAVSYRCNQLSHSVISYHNGSSFWTRKNPRHHLL